MIKKLLKCISKLAPTFLHTLDDYLIVRHPLIWSLRIHYVIYYNTIVISLCSGFIYLVPVSAANSLNLLYFFYISLILNLFSLGLWLFTQNKYNIQKSHGYGGKLYTLKYSLLIFMVFVVFVTAAFAPVWVATIRAYDQIVGEELIELIENQEPTGNYYDDRIHNLDFFRSLPDFDYISRNYDASIEYYEERATDVKKLREALKFAETKKQRASISKDLGKEEARLELSEAALASKNPLFRSLYDLSLVEAKSNLRRRDLSIPTGKIISYKNEDYVQHRLSKESYNYTERLFYLDKNQNPYFQNDLINLFFIERLLEMLFGSDVASMHDLIEGNSTLNDKQTRRFFNNYDDIVAPPNLYEFVSDFQREGAFGIVIFIGISFPLIMLMMLATTTANLFGAKSFFIDTTSTAAFVIFWLVLAEIIDSTWYVDDDDLFFLLAAFVFALSVLVNILQRRSVKRRKLSTFLWQASTFCTPSSLFLMLIICVDEYLDYSFNDTAGFTSIIVFSLVSLLFLLPFQLRLAHKIFALPR